MKKLISSCERVVILAPHTDDGEFGCGGLIARLIEEGKDVFYASFSLAEESVPEGFPKDVLQLIAAAADRQYDRLAEFNMDVIRKIREVAEVSTQFSKVSNISDLRHDPSERLVEFCEATVADRYLCGAGSIGYQEEAPFRQKAISVCRYCFTEPALGDSDTADGHCLSVLVRIAQSGIGKFSADLHKAICGTRVEAVP